MHRCLELAKLGAGYTAPNPLVGAVLVHGDRIIGEGYHKVYGMAHAEVNCIDSVKPEDRHLISQSTLYVSLEPCAHTGKTPPCSDLIIRCGIPECIIACRDPFEKVNGKGIEKLLAAGIVVKTGILEREAQHLNRRFFTFHTKQRPFVILKWAQSSDRIIGVQSDPGKSDAKQRLLISNEYSNRLVHRWRSEETAILIGTNTARFDNPELTTRWWPGRSPIRLVIDMNLTLPLSLKIFDGSHPSVIFNSTRHREQGNPAYYQFSDDAAGLPLQICNALYRMNIQSVMIEGGARLLQSFIDAGLWDEARVITNSSLMVANTQHKKVAAPNLTGSKKMEETRLLNDILELFIPTYENL